MPRLTTKPSLSVPSRRIQFEVSDVRFPSAGPFLSGRGDRGGAASILNSVTIVTFDSRSEEALTAWLTEGSAADATITTDVLRADLKGAVPFSINSTAGGGTETTLQFARANFAVDQVFE